jgi:hypothetical protein
VLKILENSFNLTTTLIGINVTDAFFFASHHKVINLNDDTGPSKLSIQQFAGLQAFQLIQKAKHLNLCPYAFFQKIM